MKASCHHCCQDPIQRQYQQHKGSKKQYCRISLNQEIRFPQQSAKAMYNLSPNRSSSARLFKADTAETFSPNGKNLSSNTAPSGHIVSTRNTNNAKKKNIHKGSRTLTYFLPYCFCTVGYTIRKPIPSPH